MQHPKKNKIENYIKVKNKCKNKDINRLNTLNKLKEIAKEKTIVYLATISASAAKERVEEENVAIKDNNTTFNISLNTTALQNIVKNIAINNSIGGSDTATGSASIAHENLLGISFHLSQISGENELIKNVQETLPDPDKYINKDNNHLPSSSTVKIISPIDKQTIINNFKKCLLKYNIQTLCNVYQSNYNNNKQPTGLGDYIRGSLFLVQFCNIVTMKYGIKLNYAFIIPHVLSCVLLPAVSCCPIEHVHVCENNNWLHSNFSDKGQIQDNLNSDMFFYDFLQFIIDNAPQRKIIDETTSMLYIYTIAFPLIPSRISQATKKPICDLFEPNDAMKLYYNNAIVNLFGEFEPNKFIVIHIRCGDKYLNENKKDFNILYLQELKKILTPIIQKFIRDQAHEHIPSKLLLIADNNAIKEHLINSVDYPPGIFTCHKNTFKHLGEGVNQDINNVQNTMLDFYLLANAGRIYSITSYVHGSGFSRWCAFIYNVPYYSYYVAP